MASAKQVCRRDDGLGTSQVVAVRYVLEGSVRRDASRVRFTAQLIDAATGSGMGTPFSVMSHARTTRMSCRTAMMAKMTAASRE